jgi:hypothetical protein
MEDTLSMFKFLILSLFSVLLFSSAFGGIIKDKTHFDTLGAVDSFRWAPERYEGDFRYDIFYYIPESLTDKSQVGALIFNHGGGSSTMTREGSIRTVGLYMPDLKKLADELGIIVVLPSANGLNWGGHTRGLLRDLARKMRKELDIDVNRLGVSGHSMGGMGITRSYLWGADEFAFFLPLAAGMDVNHQTEQHLNKVFNVPYVHLQGLKDHFEIFITRCEEQIRRTQELQIKYNQLSMLDVIFFDGTHQYNYQLFRHHLNKLLTNFPRNLYQKELWGSLHTVKLKNTENNIVYDYDSESRYFWVEATQTDLSVPERIDFHAKIEGQKILLEMENLPKQSKGLRLYLHSSMINLNGPIDVYLNGVNIVSRIPKESVASIFDEFDPGFIFEDTIEFNF